MQHRTRQYVRPQRKRAFAGLVGRPVDDEPRATAPVVVRNPQMQQDLTELMANVARSKSDAEVRQHIAAVGRPRQHVDSAAKQRAYRQRLKTKAELAAIKYLLSGDRNQRQYLEALAAAGFDAEHLGRICEVLGDRDSLGSVMTAAPRGFGRPVTGQFDAKKLAQVDAKRYLRDYEERAIASLANKVRPEGNGPDQDLNDSEMGIWKKSHGRRFPVKCIRSGDQIVMDELLSTMTRELFRQGQCVVCGRTSEDADFHLVVEHKNLVVRFFRERGVKFRSANLTFSIR